jgi:hypothetical protein
VPRPRAAVVLDWLALAAAVLAVVIALTGGSSFRIGGTRITARSPERAAFAVLAIVALRVAIDRRTRPFAGAPAVLRRIRDRVYDPRLDRVADRDDGAVDPRRWRTRALALAGFCAFGGVLLLPQLLHMDSVPDLGDPLFSIWRFGWVFHDLAGDPRPLFSPNIFHPHQLTLTYSDSMLLPALTAAPLLAIGVHPVTVYNIVMIASFIASAVALYLLAERLTASPASAFIAGLLFGFYPYRFEHYSHFELQMTYCMPLALLALHRFVATTRMRYAVTFALLAAAQLYSSMYYAVFFTLFVAVLGPCLLLTAGAPGQRVKRMLVPAIVAGELAIGLALPLARTYTSAQLGDREADTVAYYSATAADYLRAHPRSATWGTRTLPGRMPERALFPGVMILLLAALALVPRIGATRAAYAVALVAIFEVSRGFNGVLYPVLYESLAFVRGLRVPARASVLVGLTLALLAAFGVRRLLAWSDRLRPSLATRGAVVGVLVVLIAVDLRPLLRLEPVWREPPPIYGALAGTPNVVLAEFPFGGNPTRFTPNAPFLYFSLWHWAQMLNGYSGHYPPGQGDFETALQRFPEPPTLDLLRGRGATHVSINCALYRGGCDSLIERVDALLELRVVASGRWQGAIVRLYELRDPQPIRENRGP